MLPQRQIEPRFNLKRQRSAPRHSMHDRVRQHRRQVFGVLIISVEGLPPHCWHPPIKTFRAVSLAATTMRSDAAGEKVWCLSQPASRQPGRPAIQPASDKPAQPHGQSCAGQRSQVGDALSLIAGNAGPIAVMHVISRLPPRPVPVQLKVGVKNRLAQAQQN